MARNRTIARRRAAESYHNQQGVQLLIKDTFDTAEASLGATRTADGQGTWTVANGANLSVGSGVLRTSNFGSLWTPDKQALAGLFAYQVAVADASDFDFLLTLLNNVQAYTPPATDLGEYNNQMRENTGYTDSEIGNLGAVNPFPADFNVLDSNVYLTLFTPNYAHVLIYSAALDGWIQRGVARHALNDVPHYIGIGQQSSNGFPVSEAGIGHYSDSTLKQDFVPFSLFNQASPSSGLLQDVGVVAKIMRLDFTTPSSFAGESIYLYNRWDVAAEGDGYRTGINSSGNWTSDSLTGGTPTPTVGAAASTNTTYRLFFIDVGTGGNESGAFVNATQLFNRTSLGHTDHTGIKLEFSSGYTVERLHVYEYYVSPVWEEKLNRAFNDITLLVS